MHRIENNNIQGSFPYKVGRLLIFILLLAATPKLSKAQINISISRLYDSVEYKIDSTSKLHIHSIEVIGNKNTKTYIILRELLFKEGDSVISGLLYDVIENSRQLVYNTTLFITTEITPIFREGRDVDIKIIVKEKWFIFPLPQFQWVDRNFNEWISTYHADLDRVIYGFKFLDYNFSGRRDQLKLFLLTGYSRNISIAYNAPYSNSKLTEGFSFSAGYTQNREISYKTTYNNTIQQYNNGSFVRNILNVNGTYQLRRGFYKRHYFFMGYTHMKLADTVVNYFNPKYFSNQEASTGYPEAGFFTTFIHVDNINYPLEGKLWSMGISKRGWSIKGNNSCLTLDAAYTKLIEHPHNFYSSFQVSGKLKVPFDQPYINQRALGYESFYLRGMEYYVVDGVAAVLGKYTIRKKIYAFKIPVPFNIKALPFIPFGFYAKAYADAGYCYNKPEFKAKLNNKFLYSGGIGLDILTLYDISLRLEYSINQLGEKGLFLHSKGGF